MARPKHTSQDFELPEEREIDLSSNKPLDDDQIYVVTGESMKDERLQKIMKEESDMKKFMEQKVTFMISETTNENEVNPVSCGVNGEHRYFWRGKEYTEARKFLDSLIKVTNHVKTVNYKDKDGVDQTNVVTKPVLAYPLTVLRDPAGDMGAKWFRHQQSNAF